MVVEELSPPTVRLDLEEGAVVFALRLPCPIALDMPASAVDPLVDVAGCQDEPAARVLPIEHVEVHAEALDVGVRVVTPEVLEKWLALTDGLLDRPP